MWSFIAWVIHHKEIPLMSHSPVSGIPFCTTEQFGHYRTLRWLDAISSVGH
jgi:hypothetical protein